MAEPLVSQEKPFIPALQTAQFVTAPAMAPGVEDSLHELRVRIPVDLHRQLLSLKILRGKSLAETVSTALDIYFEEHQRNAAAAQSES